MAIISDEKKYMGRQETSDLIMKYARYYHHKYSNAGFSVDEDELKGILGLVFAEASILYDPENVDCSFRTYIINAFRYKIKDYIDGVVEKMNEGEISDCCLSVDGAESYIEMVADSTVENEDGYIDFMQLFDGRELLIVKEIISPSEQMQAYAEAYAAKRPTFGRTDGERNGMLRRGMQFVYGMSRSSFKRSMTKIRERLSNICGGMLSTEN